MGYVFLAHDRLLGKDVALKVMREDLAENPKTVTRFVREVALAHSVTHPNVVRIYDTGQWAGIPYLSMELLQGQPLDEAIRNARHGEAALSVPEIREIAGDVLDGLHAAHQAGVVHRDLKPANVMLTTRGAIVMDFGVAAIDVMPDVTGSPINTLELKSLVKTDAGTVYGSPAYMAPELWEGAPATPQSDLFAFGVLLYQMLTGRLPYDARTASAYLEKLRTGTPPPIRAQRKDAPLTMLLLVKRCMSRLPMDRPPTAAAAGNLISPLRKRRRRMLVAGSALGIGITSAAVALARLPPDQAVGLPDAAAQTDLAAAVRAWDVGDRRASQGHLERLRAHSNDVASVAFWSATLRHEMRDEDGRRDVCTANTWRGAPNWKQLATQACGETYNLSAAALATLRGGAGSLDAEFLPLAIERSLIPRLEGARKPEQSLVDEANQVLDRLRTPPSWSPDFAIPTRWALARFDLQVAMGRFEDARVSMEQLGGDASPVTLEHAAWFNVLTGNRAKAAELAERLGADHPTPTIRLLMEQGKMREAWDQIVALDGRVPTHALTEMWCGYAFRYEVNSPPPQCTDLPPGLVRAMWGTSDNAGLDLATMTPLEQTITRRQRELNMGECERGSTPGPILSHASAPFEAYLPQLEIGAAVCAHDPAQGNAQVARKLANATLAVVPKDPWIRLLRAQVEEMQGETAVAKAQRQAVAAHWKDADHDLPLVRRLREKLAPAGIVEEGPMSVEPEPVEDPTRGEEERVPGTSASSKPAPTDKDAG